MEARSIRRAWIMITVLIVAGFGMMFATHFKSFTKTKQEIRTAMEQHDWQGLSKMMPPIKLQQGTMAPDRLVAFLDRYVAKDKKLDISEREYVGQTGIEANFADDHILPGMRTLTPRIALLVVPDRNPIPFLPPTPRIKCSYDMMFVAVAMHEFPGTEHFDPRHWSAKKYPNQSKNYVPSQFLFASREKANLDAMRMPTYMSGEYTPQTWDNFISNLRKGLTSSGWDVAALLKAYKLADSEAPAKDSRRPVFVERFDFFHLF